jgi:hypothetical protein
MLAERVRRTRQAIARSGRHMRKYGQPMGLGEKIGAENIFLSVHATVEASQQRERQPPARIRISDFSQETGP